jgi:hypothetical protein
MAKVIEVEYLPGSVRPVIGPSARQRSLSAPREKTETFSRGVRRARLVSLKNGV